ncbi:ubiquinol-cytochrome c reductase iron-sulfur subunit [Mycolicibacterium goodii]|uniref:QcrA and Rieske domain-containing protein n=1 Tax=Mycolicibacterium goodii TaxID=134601 RepID=UPI000C26A86D|nr:Rieske (2Fe-2S) protein [Mycolicibacterium goodii]PJK20043.1 (2Fe-2S)-binding protein [Mycolicibacterium goodii]
MIVTRRQALVGTGISLAATTVAGCAAYGEGPTGTASPEPSRPAPAAEPAPGGGQAIAKVADVPVGSGVIVDDVVLTQPTPGVFKGFSSVCTHAGCTVNQIGDGRINCPCHGSSFNLDGTVAKGPATRPLNAKDVSVQGDSIVVR